MMLEHSEPTKANQVKLLVIENARTGDGNVKYRETKSTFMSAAQVFNLVSKFNPEAKIIQIDTVNVTNTDQAFNGEVYYTHEVKIYLYYTGKMDLSMVYRTYEETK